MSFFLVFLAVLLIGAVIWTSVGGRAGKQGGRQLPSVLVGGLEEPPANLPPVLLPANAAPQDVDSVRFSLGLRGYRMDQVDQVLDELRDQLAASRNEVETLKARLAEVARQAPAAEPDAREALPGEAGTEASEPGNNRPGTSGPGTPVTGPREPAAGQSSAGQPAAGEGQA
ncbi:DivIVA domain-containing protein [Arthrobacter sp. OV608]|uniref:DivIVA domain-containing protein n=1 Tax=Arthrobacter sp. OV608 TaxID=1882768 RepID=UPI0008C16165|nr:DivIVA domain-containing protein [Arthrobacter sp. OV608]SEP61752.1 DivIVA domain-containing protein [Arthrobacter sp. OV608]